MGKPLITFSTYSETECVDYLFEEHLGKLICIHCCFLGLKNFRFSLKNLKEIGDHYDNCTSFDKYL